MDSWSTLTAADGHRLNAYVAPAEGTSMGAVVVVQEIFGVTPHIQRVADGFAAAGYYTVAPAFFDRIGKSIRLGYDQIDEGRQSVGKLNLDQVSLDLQASVRAASVHGRVAVVGYCWGGAMAYMAAAQISEVACAIDYYGTRVIELSEHMKPRVPVLYHFGVLDKTLPPVAIAKINAADPDGIFHLYEDADHGFNCDERPQFNAGAARVALARSLRFLSARL